jgi:hypothetical protein
VAVNRSLGTLFDEFRPLDNNSLIYLDDFIVQDVWALDGQVEKLRTCLVSDDNDICKTNGLFA